MQKLRNKLLLGLFLLSASLGFARDRGAGYCENGNQTVTTAGIVSSTKVQKSFPSCTVTVYLAGTVTLATIYSDNSGTPLANPFTAASDGYWFFYADNGAYDVRLSGAGIATPFTRGGYFLFDISTANLVGGASSLTTVGALVYISSSGILGQSANTCWDTINGRLNLGGACGGGQTLTVTGNIFASDDIISNAAIAALGHISTATGDFITTNGNFFLNRSSGQGVFSFAISGISKFAIYDASDGADLCIVRYDNSGIAVDNPFCINRGNGQTTFLNIVNVAGLAASAAVNFASASQTFPFKTGTTAPATCTVGETFFDSDAVAGSNFFGCTGTNIWTLESGGGTPISNYITTDSTQTGLTGNKTSNGTWTFGAMVSTTATITTLTVGSCSGCSGAGGYATIMDEGVALTAQDTLNFIGSGVVCVNNGGASRTDCTITSGSGGFPVSDNTTLFVNQTDNTKFGKFNLEGVDPSTTSTLNWPNVTFGTIATLENPQTFSAVNTFSAQVNAQNIEPTAEDTYKLGLTARYNEVNANRFNGICTSGPGCSASTNYVNTRKLNFYDNSGATSNFWNVQASVISGLSSRLYFVDSGGTERLSLTSVFASVSVNQAQFTMHVIPTTNITWDLGTGGGNPQRWRTLYVNAIDCTTCSFGTNYWALGTTPNGISGLVNGSGSAVAVAGVSSGTNYVFQIVDPAGSPGINFYPTTSPFTKSGSISSGATSAFSVQNESDLFRFLVLQDGTVLIGRTTDAGAGKLQVDGSTTESAVNFFSNNSFTTASITQQSSTGGVTLSIFSSSTSNHALDLLGPNRTTAAIQIGNLIDSNGCKIFSGAGTPEGAVTANVCSLYLRSDGGATTTLYVKTSGSGNTGWTGK